MKKYIFILSTLILFFIQSKTSWSLTADAVYQKVNQSVYAVINFDAYKREYNVIGSSVAISPNILATNCHVALAPPQLAIKIGQQIKLAKIIYQNTRRDLCLVYVPNANFTPISLRDTSHLKIGEEVFAIGSPHGLERTLSKGIISNIHQKGQGPFQEGPIIQTDASISPGSSGGGIFDQEGQLVGITTFIFRPGMAENLGFAIPAKWIHLALIKSQQKAQNEKIDLDETEILNHPTKQQHLKHFGKSNISVLASKKYCFIYMPGHDSKGRVLGGMVFSPNFPHVLFPFFDNKPFENALNNLAKIQKIGQGHFIGYLYVHRKNQEIIAYRTNTQSLLFVVEFPEDLTHSLLQVKQFFAQLKHRQSFHGYTAIQYSTDGLKEALNYCHKTTL